MPRKQKAKREKVRLTVEQQQEAREVAFAKVTFLNRGYIRKERVRSTRDFEIFLQAFDLYDVDGSGEIDEHELLLAFKSLGFSSKPAEVRKMVSLYDTDGNGHLPSPFQLA